jgi:hypothetical protein
VAEEYQACSADDAVFRDKAELAAVDGITLADTPHPIVVLVIAVLYARHHARGFAFSQIYCVAGQGCTLAYQYLSERVFKCDEITLLHLLLAYPSIVEETAFRSCAKPIAPTVDNYPVALYELW